MPDELTIKEIAEDLGVSYVTALRYVKCQIGGAVRRGGRWYVPAARYQAFKATGNQPSVEED